MSSIPQTTYIYVLIDPRDGRVRYVGKSDNPHRRLISHTHTDSPTTHRGSWIRGLKQQGLRPVLTVVEEVPYAEWQARECYWIDYYRAQGADLTNIADGGIGPTPTPETRAKQRAAKLGKPAHNRGQATPPEARAKQSEAAQRRWARMSPEERAAYQARINRTPPVRPAGWHHTPEARAKIAEAGRGNQRTKGYHPTQETIEKQRAARLGRSYSEPHRSNIAHARGSLTDAQVDEIRRLLAAGGMTQRAIAAQMGVSEYMVSLIKLGKAYKHHGIAQD